MEVASLPLEVDEEGRPQQGSSTGSGSSSGTGYYGHKNGTRSIRNFGVYGGSKINITEVPFMALYRPKDVPFFCGASIVHEQFVVTAAHCYYKDKEYKVTVGTDDAFKGLDYEIEKSFIHPEYNSCSTDFDVLVLKLKKKLVFDERVQSIKLADPGLVIKDEEMLDTMGFGLTEKNELSKTLLKVDLPYVDQEKCKQIYKEKLHVHDITDRMVCVGGDAGKDSCSGDSGGPLRYKDQLAGIVSFGPNPCGTEGIPGVYSRISALRPFIDDVIKNNS